MAGKPPQKGPGIGPGRVGPQTRKDEAVRSDARQTSLEAGRVLQRILDAAPAAQSSKAVDATTRAAAERVLNLAASVELRVPEGRVTDADIDRRIDELRQPLAIVRARTPGEELRLGDEVLLELLGYLSGDVFLAHTDTWYRVAPNRFLPGLFESLAGSPVPGHRIVTVRLPDDYPVPAQAGRTAVFAVTVKQARVRELPEVQDPMFLPFVNRGVKTLDDLREVLRDELVRERAQQMVEHAKLLLLRELYVRCMSDDVPEPLIDEEMNRRWRELKGDSLVRQGVALDEQKKSQQAYASDVVLRAEARRTIWEYRILESIAVHFGIEVTEQSLKPVLHAIFGADADVDKLLYKNPALHKDLLKGMRMRRAAEALLKRARVAFDAPPTPPDKAFKPLVDPEPEEERSLVTASRGLRRPPSKANRT